MLPEERWDREHEDASPAAPPYPSGAQAGASVSLLHMQVPRGRRQATEAVGRAPYRHASGLWNAPFESLSTGGN